MGHVACQINVNDTYNNMPEKKLSLHIPFNPVVASKGQISFLSENGHVVYQLKENSRTTTCNQKFALVHKIDFNEFNR